jgi:hypothetical protein
MPVQKFGGFGRFTVGVTVAAVLGASVLVAPEFSGILGSPAWAQEGSGGKGNAGEGGSGQGGQGQGGEGKGQGGPGEDSDGQGPKAGSGGSGGGKPVWAQEGIPEVELGRLSVARSPDAVLDRALAEAVASLTPDMVAFYNLSYDDLIAELSLNFDNVTFIDSPLQNLALLEDLLADGTALTGAGVTTDETLLAAILLGAASDKTIDISTETVIAVTTILGTPITGTAAEQLADLADSIRVAILAGHS